MAWKLNGFFGWGIPALVVALVITTPVAHADVFTIIALPDTQNYSATQPDPDMQTQWAVNNRIARNIVFVAHLGDVVNTPTQTERRTNISDAMAKLDGILPYSVVPGNHDSDTNIDTGADPFAEFLAVFGAARYASMDGFGGQMSPTRPSFYQFFDANGIRFLHLGLEYQYENNGVKAWAQGIIDANPGLPILLTTHGYLDTQGRGRNAKAQGLWDDLIKINPQIFMVLSGHFRDIPATFLDGAEFHQTSINNAGLPVLEMLSNYQDRTFGGDSLLRIIDIDMTADEVNVQTYNPKRDEFETDANSQFTMNLDLDPRLSLCNDGIDNNFDGHVDFPADTDCGGYAGSFEGVLIVLPSLTASGTALLILLLAALGIPAMSARSRKPDA
jgi:hypothetical protein